MAKVKGKSNLEKPSKLQELLDKNQSFLLRSSGQFHQLQLILKNLIKLVYLASIFLIANLKRLQLDYLDIIFCHRFYEDIPLEETAKAYNDLIEQGLIHYWGTSELSAREIFEVKQACTRLNIIPPVSEQPQFSMIIREKFEVEYRRLFDKYKLRATVWSPLYNNILTGRYNDDTIPKGSILQEFIDNIYMNRIYNQHFADDKKEILIKLLNALGNIAKRLKCTQSQLEMAWVLANTNYYCNLKYYQTQIA